MFKFKKKDKEDVKEKSNVEIIEDSNTETKTEITKDDLFAATKKDNKEVKDNPEEEKEDTVLDQDTEMKSPEEIKKEEKEKKIEDAKDKTKKGFNKYKFIAEIVSLVLLIAFAIILFVKTDHATFILLLVTGGITIVASLFVLFGLIKTEFESIVKKITLIIGLANLVVGIYIILTAILYNNMISDPDKNKQFLDYIEYSYQYFLVGILYSYSILYLWKTCLYKIKATKFMFWLHIFFMVAASSILAFSSNKDQQFTITRLLFVIAIVCCVYALILLIDAILNYHNYNNGQNRKKKEKAETKKEDTKENESQDNVILDKNENIDNINDRDQNIIS